MKQRPFFLAGYVLVCLALHTYLPVYRAHAFITGLRSANPQRINALLPEGVSFRKDALVGGDWYSFFYHEKPVIGPFPLAAYHDDLTLNLRLDDISPADWLVGRRSVRVFGQHFPKQFIISYFGRSYRQGIDPPGQAG